MSVTVLVTALPSRIFSSRQKNMLERAQEKVNEFVDRIQDRVEEIYSRVHDKVLLMRDAAQVKIDEITERVLGHRVAQLVINYGKQAYNNVCWTIVIPKSHKIGRSYRMTYDV